MLRITGPADHRHEEFDAREADLRTAADRARQAREARGAPRGRAARTAATALYALATWLAGEPERRPAARQPSA